MQLLLTEEERRMFAAAAETRGETLSAWLRRAGREKILREEGRRLGLRPTAVGPVQSLQRPRK